MPWPDAVGTTAPQDRDVVVAGRIAWAIALACVATIAAVRMLQASGYVPCELCLQERIPYYVAIPMAVLSGVACLGPWWRLARIGMVFLVCAFVTGIALGTYHTGVEWGLWAGPSACSWEARAAADLHDFLRQLDHVQVVRCDEPALVVLGFSLAGWNALVSLVLAALAASTIPVLGPRRT